MNKETRYFLLNFLWFLFGVISLCIQGTAYINGREMNWFNWVTLFAAFYVTLSSFYKIEKSFNNPNTNQDGI